MRDDIVEQESLGGSEISVLTPPQRVRVDGGASKLRGAFERGCDSPELALLLNIFIDPHLFP